jgi:hypothetical protein
MPILFHLGRLDRPGDPCERLHGNSFLEDIIAADPVRGNGWVRPNRQNGRASQAKAGFAGEVK